STLPGTPLAGLFQDPARQVPLTNPFSADGLGNYKAYVDPGVYTIQIYGNGIATEFVLTDQASIGSPAVPVNARTGTTYTVLDSDNSRLITVNNSTAVTVTLPQAGSANQFVTGWYAYFQNRGTGTVTITPTVSTVDGLASLALTTNQGCLISSDGQNYFSMRGIGSAGGSSNAGFTTVTFSATPTFDSSVANTFQITLTGNVTSSTLVNAVAGEILTFIIIQDATGSRSFQWPTNVKTAEVISATANSRSIQSFIFDGTNAYPIASLTIS